MDERIVFGMILLAVIAGVAVLWGALSLSGYEWEKHVVCPSFAQSVERPYRYTFANGCFIQAPNGQWVHYSNYWNEKGVQ